MSTLRKRTSTLTQLQSLIREVRNVHISNSTVSRRLHESSLASNKPATGPLLTRAHRRARLHFAQEHVEWNLEDWQRVLFSDETRVSLHSPDGRQRVWRRVGERFADGCMSSRVPFGGGSVMFWGGISFDARTELVCVPRPALNAHRYVTDILEEHVVPFAPFIGPNFILMHDNARPHSASVVTDYLHEVGVTTMDWPPRSPDMNPIEHVWDMLKRRIRARDPPPDNLQQLETAAKEEWNNIPQDDIKTLIRGMNRRIEALLRARGSNTRY